MQPATAPRAAQRCPLVGAASPRGWFAARQSRDAPDDHRRPPRYLQAGDLLVLNDAATMPASLMGVTATGSADRASLAGRAAARDQCGRGLASGPAGCRRLAHRDRAPPTAPSLQPGDRLFWARRRDESDRIHAGARSRSGAGRRGDVSPDRRAVFPARCRVSAGAVRARQAHPVQLSQKTSYACGRCRRSTAHAPGRPRCRRPASPLSWQILLSLRQRGVELAWLTHAAGISSSGDPLLIACCPARAI